LRQDPDVILVGEMRDLETMSAALTIAETGHLALATLHTNSTFESINRIVDAFPASQQGQVRAQLAFVLEGVVTQQLIPKASGKGRVMICEVMVCTPAIRATIRDDKVHQIYGLMQAGHKFGMQTMNQALFQAFCDRTITKEECLRRSSDPVELQQMLGDEPGSGRDSRSRDYQFKK
ncbi:MAG: Flp pilus assembly complex ATPase component TadA, partial [Candidatus Krumholzibacteria bacterium]|nr:Flp pilus assembly complex ATPase component TadA [Candidatus Krumholzibacteria bacterium]